MSGKTIIIKKGLDINFGSQAKQEITKITHSELFDIVPDFYHGITPKLKIKVGDTVKVGTPIFRSKRDEAMNFTSPVSGKIKEIIRGERRKILKIVIEADNTDNFEYVDYSTKSVKESTEEELKSILLESGLWTFIKQRPFDIIADPTKTPKAIFISTFDTSPAAPDYEFILKDKINELQTGIDAVSKLCPNGKVFLGLKSENSIFNNVKGVEKTIFKGKHPAGNVGVQINHTQPINKGEAVWTINAQDLCLIGRLFISGKVDFTKTIAITGTEVSNPHYVETIAGNNLKTIIAKHINEVSFPLRYISGNVLTGIKIKENDCISPYHNQVTVLDDGSETHEVFGWAMPRLDKFSNSSLFLSKLFKGKTFKWDARILGGRRAIIMSNEYEKVFPMDIMPEQLIKAMIAGNIDRMESLGVYEIAPEDFALCEFVDTSKLPLQAIVREGLNKLRNEIE